jgi:hypothetical protein
MSSRFMHSILMSLISTIFDGFRTCLALQTEMLALRNHHRLEAIRFKPAQTSSFQPIPLDLALTPLVPVALGSRYHQTRDGHRLASQGLPPVLDLEMPARSLGEAKDLKRYR